MPYDFVLSFIHLYHIITLAPPCSHNYTNIFIARSLSPPVLASLTKVGSDNQVYHRRFESNIMVKMIINAGLLYKPMVIKIYHHRLIVETSSDNDLSPPVCV